VGRKEERQNYDYILSNTTLEHVEKEKDIGVAIDSKLTFEHHMNEKINKTNSTMV
jgi:2-polyprenyl-3-methyl-5-hydroxy-6-metoxy-1,4-benzoquinol methylase